MGLLDVFKKKSADKPVETGTSLNDLPPIPQNPVARAQEENSPSDEGLPPTPGADPFPESTLGSSEDIPQPTESSLDDVDLEVPDNAQINPEPLEPVDELPPVALESESSETSETELVPQPESQGESTDFTAEISTDDMSVNIEENEPVTSLDSSDQTLPSFQDLQNDVSLLRSGTQLGSDPSTSVDIKTESLLLKSIFVEKEHYANILFSLKRVKDDLQKSGPQQRKLAHVDMKLAKEYSKLSTLFENANENLMVIEHIVSNDQF